MSDIRPVFSNNKDFGKAGEAAACGYLKKRGYNILERNFSASLGEIDIVAEDGGVLVFAEVKTRRSTFYGMPEEAVDIKKRQKLTRLARLYMSKKNLLHRQARFDVISICVHGGFNDMTVKLIKNAFDAEE